MTPRAARPLALGVTLALGALAPGGLRAQGRAQAYPTDPASAAYSASASAALLAPRASASGGHKPWVPERGAPIPSASSPAPTREEWKTAPIAVEARNTEPGCRVLRLREWYRIDCEHTAMQLIAGAREELTFGQDGNFHESRFYTETWAIFPARRGVTRFLQIYRFGKWGPQPDANASIHWLDGEETPRITVQGLRWGI